MVGAEKCVALHFATQIVVNVVNVSPQILAVVIWATMEAIVSTVLGGQDVSMALVTRAMNAIAMKDGRVSNVIWLFALLVVTYIMAHVSFPEIVIVDKGALESTVPNV